MSIRSRLDVRRRRPARRRRRSTARDRVAPAAAEVLEQRLLLSSTTTDVEPERPSFESLTRGFTSLNAKTTAFIERLTPGRYEVRGSDFTSPFYSPLRLGKPLDAIDRVYEYDWDRLDEVEGYLDGVNRHAAMAALFRLVTHGSANNTERHLRLTEFLQKATYHSSYLQPVYRDQQIVTDPLVLLELGEMRCGHVARVAVDLWQSVGYQARVVQVGSHVLAEAHYDGRWHYVDADVYAGGAVALKPDGTVPSVAELSRNPGWLDRLSPAYSEPNHFNGLPAGGSDYASYFYTSRDAYVGYSPWYLEKTSLGVGDRYYGWRSYEITTASDIRVSDVPLRHSPGAPRLVDVTTNALPEGGLEVDLDWLDSIDNDGDLLGYRVFVSERSRGWNYDGQSLPAELMSFKSGDLAWHPNTYDARFHVPPSEVALVDTAESSATFTLPEGRYHVSVMPYDAYGESVGRELYHLSEEIVIGAPKNAPLLPPLEDVHLEEGVTETTIPLDPSPDPAALTGVEVEVALVDPLLERAYRVDSERNLRNNGDYFVDAIGRDEKWMRSDVGWHYLQPDGSLYAWSATTPFEGDLVARFDPSYYADPTKLWQATRPNVAVDATGAVAVATYDADDASLRIAVNETFSGSFRVEVAASTADASVSRTMRVHVPGGGSDGTVAASARIDSRVRLVPTTVDPATGETAALPDNEPRLHEWQTFWVELYGSSLDGAADVEGGTLRVDYEPRFFTATTVEAGPAFSLDGPAVSDQSTGTVTLAVAADAAGLGDDAAVLLARVKFESVGDDGVPMDFASGDFGPFDLGLHTSGTVTLDTAGTLPATTGAVPATELFPVSLDVNDDARIDFADLGAVLGAFLAEVPSAGATTAESESGDAVSAPIAADANADGVVDFDDVSVFFENFLRQRGDAILLPPGHFDGLRRGRDWFGARGNFH